MRRLKSRGVIRVLGQRAVTGLARHPRMDALALHLEYVGVAALAGPVASEDHGPVGNLGDGRAAVMTVLSEAARNKKAARQEEQCDPHHKDRRHPKEMSCILKTRHRFSRKQPLRGPAGLPAEGTSPAPGVTR